MATSAEIAQQIADQNSWFMQQNALASQVGVNPQAYGGMGGWGMGPPAAPVMAPAPGQSMPGAFNFGGGYGYGAGNRMGAMGAAATSALPFVGAMFGGSSPMFNPAAGFMAARGMGMGMMGAGAAAGLMAAPVAFGAHALSSMAHGGQQNAMLGTAVSNFGFSNTASMSGQGFSRQDVAGVSRQVRQLAMIPELMTSFEEITRILPQLKQMGTMTGVRDAAEFNRRMKEAIGTIRDVSKIIGTTMEDAAQFFGHSQRVGFFGKQDQLKNALNAQVTMSVTGMSQQQFQQMQERGAAFGTAVGGSRALGAKGIENIANRLGMTAMNNQGFMNTLQNMTGKVGEEAIMDAAGQYQMMGQKIAGSSLGRYMIAGFTKFGEDGSASLDEELMARQQRGEVSMDQIYAMGQRNMSNQNNVVAFTRHQTTLGQRFTEQGGLEGAFTLLKERLGAQKAAVVMQNQYGVSEEQMNALESSAQEGTTGMGDQKRMVSEIVRRNAQRRMNSAGGVWQRLKTRMGNQLTQPFEELGADIHHNVGQFVDEVMEDMAGDVFIQATESAKKDFAAGLQGDKGALSRAFSKGSGTSGPTSLTSDISNAFKSTELYAFFNKSSTTTGRTAQAEFNRLRELGGAGGSSAADLAARFDAMGGDLKGLVGGWANDKSFTEGISSEAQGLAQRIQQEMAMDPTFANASPQEKFDRMRSLAGSSGDSLRGKTSADVASVMVMQAQKYLGSNGITGAQLSETGFTGFDPTSVATNLRTAREDLGDTFREAAPLIQKSPQARAFLKKFYEASPDEQQRMLIGLHNGQGEGLSADDARTLGAGLSKSQVNRLGKESGKSAFNKFASAQAGADTVAMQDALGNSAASARAAAEGLEGPLKEAVLGYSAAASGLQGAMGTAGAGAAADKLGASIDQVATLIEKGGDLTGIPPELITAARRRAGTKRSLRGLVGQEVSIKSLMENTGLDEADIRRATGANTGATVSLDQRAADALQKASGRSGVAAVIGGSAQATKDQAKQDQQLVLMKTMTEALVAIAGDKMPSKAREAWTKNKQAADGNSNPGWGPWAAE